MLAHLVERRLIGGDWQIVGWFASFLPAMSTACSLENARLSVVDLDDHEVVVHHFENNRGEDAKELAIDTLGMLGPPTFARSRQGRAEPTTPTTARLCRARADD
jgi:hypothetical protein